MFSVTWPPGFFASLFLERTNPVEQTMTNYATSLPLPGRPLSCPFSGISLSLSD